MWRRPARTPLTASLLLILTIYFLYGFHDRSSSPRAAEDSDTTPIESKLLSSQVSPFDILAPEDSDATSNYTWITHNQRGMHALFRCIEGGNCQQNQTKVILISSNDFISPLQGGYIGGEAIWAMSTLKAIKNLGYTPLFAATMEAAAHFHQLLGPFIKIILVSHAQNLYCHSHPPCTKTAHNPGGIPSWKLLTQHFWADGANINPLGAQWTLSPEDYRPRRNTTYLGYSVEPQCTKYPFIPHSQRGQEKAPQVYILAKYLKFFNPALRPAWTPEIFDAAANETGARFLMAARHLPEESDEQRARSRNGVAKSIENTLEGRLDEEVPTQKEFYGMLGRSVALVGMGNPMLSPTPYDALCLGVPFINPILNWDRTNPSDRSRWRTQHDGLKDLSPPYVYNVRIGDQKGFTRAIRQATENPIERYVLERIKLSSVEERLGRIVEWDWRSEAAMIMREREKRGEAPS
ncbi:hypothetical protein R3P38DRAFT_3533140 [Favolaschia claudopus]|uniref:Alpha-1,6-mannosyl-glycoprotein 6-beta-N-acetylglucosaminyltransferase n=1 Tax=Favolaschia claudopus TaxID=2862362 RepID=A0AAW0BF87_9AGAR